MSFNTKNNLLKVKPNSSKGEWKYFKSYPIESLEQHSVEVKKEAEKEGIQYRINLRTREYEIAK